jgi:glucose uptake protein GlcU
LSGGYFNLLIGFIGILLLILGVNYVSKIRERSKSKISKAGLFLAFLSASLWSLQFVSVRMASADPFSIVVPMTFGMAVTSWVYTVLIDRKTSASISTLKMSSLSGATWVIGNYLGFFAINDIGLVRTFSIAQIANLVAVLWSILYFKEFVKRKNVLVLIFSVILIILGAGLISIAKT